jgi:NAD(P)-dependent dehydrogenase (short-subunit alcohol dehydrogenase family)
MVALITGGGTGIGLMMARALAAAGAARVYIVGRRVDVLQEAVAKTPPGGNASAIVPLYCDVTSKASLESVVAIVEKDVGYLNLLVCNAGVGGPQVRVPSGVTLEEWRDAQMGVRVEEFTGAFEVNATSVWFTAMAFLGLLDKGNKTGVFGTGEGAVSSQVLVTSSIAAFNKAAPGGFAYGASKAAATHIAKMLSVALPPWGIR